MDDKDQNPAAIASDSETSLGDAPVSTGERRPWSAPRLSLLPIENTLGPSTFSSGQAAHVS